MQGEKECQEEGISKGFNERTGNIQKVLASRRERGVFCRCLTGLGCYPPLEYSACVVGLCFFCVSVAENTKKYTKKKIKIYDTVHKINLKVVDSFLKKLV